MKSLIIKYGFKKDNSYNDSIEFFRKENWGVSIFDGDYTFYRNGSTVKKIRKDENPEILEDFLKQNL